MIQNPTILEKLKKKTVGDPQMFDFLSSILENESEGKQYSKFFKTQIEKATKQIK